MAINFFVDHNFVVVQFPLQFQRKKERTKGKKKKRKNTLPTLIFFTIYPNLSPNTKISPHFV